jgi:hypothetical protein
MAVQVKVDFDKGPANKALGEVQDTAANRFKELGKIAEESLKFEKIKAGLEGLKVFAENLGPILGQADKDTAKTVDKMVKLGDAGFKIGSMFGPLGGLIGGAIGVVAGYFVAASEKAAALRLKLTEIRNAAEDSRAKLAEMDQVTIAAVSKEIDQFRDKIYGVGRDAEAARNAVRQLLGIGAKELAESFDAAAASTAGLKDATIAILQPVELTADQAKAKLNEAAKLVKYTEEQIKEAAGRIRKNIKEGVNDEATLKQQEKLLDALKRNLVQYTKAQLDAAGAIRKAIDADIAAEEAAKNKAADAAKKREEKQTADWEKERLKRQAIAEKTTQAIADREMKWYQDQQAAQAYFADLEERNTRARVALIQSTKEARDKDAADAKANAERLLAEQLAMYNEAKAGFEKLLAPMGAIVSATFGQISKNIEQGNKAFRGVGLAAKAAVADVLKAFAKQWGAQALSEVAAGLASLALGPVGGVSAASHFAAAAGYGAAAAAAGLGGAVVARNVAASSGGSSSSASSSAPSSSNGSPFLGSKQQTSGGQIIVQMNGNLFMGSGDDRALEEPGRNLGRALAVAAGVDRRIAA